MSKKVALMCGHGRSCDGSWDCGTSYGGYTEAGLMLPITKSAVKYLRSWGVKVISDADTGNNKNMIVDVAWANKVDRSKSDSVPCYISLHCDWYKAGSGTYPLVYSAEGKKLAKAINKSVMKATGMKTRGIATRRDLYELSATDMPACVFETGSIRADIKTLKKNPDTYGKAIAKGICNYLGVDIKAPKTETKVEPKKTEPKKTEAKTLYRVRHSWNEPSTQVGAFYDLESAKQSADVNHLNVYGANGKLIYSGKKKETMADKVLKACKAQAEWMQNAKYGWQSKPTIEKSKKLGTCVTFVACVLQRLGVLKSGQALWHNGKGYGTGKVTGANDKMTITYMGNESLTSLKDKLKAGDIILLDDNKSGIKGSGGHIFIVTGKWKGSDPYIWDMEPNRKCVKTQKPRTYSGKRKVLARVRLKG